MAGNVDFRVNSNVLFGMTMRGDGAIRRHMRSITRATVRVAKAEAPSRSGALERGIHDRHVWANQFGVERRVDSTAPYSLYVHEGTANNGAGRIYSRRASGRFGGLFPVGRSQGRITAFRQSVRGQVANPFLERAMKQVLRSRGLL